MGTSIVIVWIYNTPLCLVGQGRHTFSCLLISECDRSGSAVNPYQSLIFFHSSHTFSFCEEPAMRHWDGSSSTLDSVCADRKTPPPPSARVSSFCLRQGSVTRTHVLLWRWMFVVWLAVAFWKPNSKLMKIQSHQHISFVIITQAIRTEMSAVSTGNPAMPNQAPRLI